MNNKLTKIVSAILAMILIVSCFAGCGDNSDLPKADNTVYATAAEEFRYNNFANGRLSDEVLDSFTPAQLAFASCALYYEWRLQYGIKRGEKWVYTNSSEYAAQSKPFDYLIEHGEYGTNCAMIAAWAHYDLGILEPPQRIWGNIGGEFKNMDKYGKYIGAVCDVTSWGGTVSWRMLFDNGLVKPGDVFFCSGHTFCYLGDNKFMASGHDGDWHSDSSAPTEDGSHAVFETWIKDIDNCGDSGYSIYYQLSFKEDYIPKYYRNAEGKLVQNPMYDEETSLEYKAGKSAETLVPIRGMLNKESLVEYQGDRVNAIAGLTFSLDNSFHLKYLNDGDLLTDGQLVYTGTTGTYSEIKVAGTNDWIKNPTEWYNANGETSNTKSDEYKYLAGFYTQMKKSTIVNGFAIYSQNVGNSGEIFPDVEGFDILVSNDGKNWTVAYSVTDASTNNVWKDAEYDNNKASTGNYRCHYITADFEEVSAKYVMFALTEGKNTTVPGWLKFSEIQVFAAE